MSLLNILETFSHCYDEAQKMWFIKSNVTDDPSQLTSDPLKAIFFFTAFAHERAGRNPRFSLFHRVAITKTLRNNSFENALFNNMNFPSEVWSEFVKMAVKPNKQNTYGVVKNILEKLKIEKEPNLINLLGNKTLIDSFEWLKDIRGIGPKIASLLLRDINSLIKPWKNIQLEHLYCMQPIDRWVRLWSIECWPNQNWPNEYQVEKWAKIVVNLCNNHNVNPQNYNKGSWFVGSQFENLCNYFDVPESDRIHLANCVVNNFNANQILPSLKTFVQEITHKQIFPV